jgi:putative flippase GtrA
MARGPAFPLFLRSPEKLLSLRRIGWFVVVGTAAAAIHLAVVVTLVRWGGWRPPGANVVGWLVAFLCSFLGHYYTTFRGAQAPVAQAARRFFAVSALGFAANQGAYVLLLELSGMRYDIALALVLVAVACMTYLLGRHWAFRPAQ